MEAISGKIDEVFQPIHPTKIELVVRKMNDMIDPLDEMNMPKDTQMYFIHISITSNEWKNIDQVEVANVVEDGTDALNKWLMHDFGDTLVGSIYILDEKSDALPEMLKKHGIPLNKIAYDYHERECIQR